MKASRRLVTALLAALLLLSAAPAFGRSWGPLPPRQGWVLGDPPPVSALSWIVYDAKADWVIASFDAHARRPPASTTKMMTALVASEHVTMDELVTVSQIAADVGEAEVGLVPGEQVPAGDLFRAMLIRSANDAAMAVAEHVGGSIAGFSSMMNEKAAEMGMTESNFVNPHGLDEPDHYSSAADLLAIEKGLLSNPDLSAIVRSRSFTFPSAPDGTVRGGDSTNHLLTRYQGAIGVKTGFTFEAGLVLAGAAERGDRILMTVVMGSEGEGGHFVDAAALLDYGFANARILPVIGGLTYTVGDGEIDPVIAAGRVEAMTWIAASGVLVPPPPPPAPQPVLVERAPAEVPGWEDALLWAERYWIWLVGER